ncbi:uncharacterized protein MYCFIDRAFT_211426 [Pseudocercospora fijiensis CIRAD86]|uniref:Uncharacterized protein n=1 Tax=Pseudocercospora fijiensis (strain CIRAD86) TaxID=383855 RepID=M3AAQ2_PSEFD|nr:uncharacterized protein MYCFIDRAFT_211426 [Pseudocercospora fijiensis CIRAD86]EME81656.1 hypothetical protein MYCFIDRAFT_211426 [Pseudocercospora fijiensis CIRAD86]
MANTIPNERHTSVELAGWALARTIRVPERGYIGTICAIAPLQLAAQWYKQRQTWGKLEWCRAAGAAIYTEQRHSRV